MEKIGREKIRFTTASMNEKSSGLRLNNTFFCVIAANAESTDEINAIINQVINK